MSNSRDLVGWNKLLADALLPPGRADEPLYLFVDEDVLADAAGLSGSEALRGFLEVARAYISRSRPFGYAVRQARVWHRAGCQGAPPYLWALALTVLAVTGDPIGRTDSVYRVQNHLLGREEDTTPPPGYGEDVPELWIKFNRWLEDTGRDFGLPTARSHDHWVRQGWARSQGLFRFRDRQLVERFFADTGLVPGTRLDPTALLDAFERWLRYRGAAGDALRRRLSGEAEQAVAADVLAQEVARWTGQPRSNSDTSHVPGLLTFDDWTEAFGAVVRGERLLGLEVDPGDRSRLLVDESTGFIELYPAVSQRELLEEGALLTVSPGVAVRVGGNPAYVFADEPSLGLMLQVVGPVTGPDCHVLVRQSESSEVATALQNGGAVFTSRPALVDGWTWFSVHGLPSGCARLAALGVGGLAPTPRSAVRLRGGLRVAASVYLSGGEPTIELPSPGQILVDGQEHLADTAELQLAQMALDPGPHEVRCPDGHALRITSVGGMRSRAEGGGYSWPLTATGLSRRIAGPCDATPDGLSGARIPHQVESQDVPLLRSGADLEYLAAFDSGALVQFWPHPARWVAQAGIDPLQVDPLQTVRTSLPVPPRAFLSRSRHSGRIRGAEIRRGVELPPGTMHRRERPDLVGDVFSRSWDWTGPEPPRLQSQLRAAAMTWARNRQQASAQGAPLATPPRRGDLHDGALPNPFDDILWWLSEKESGTASLTGFRNTWAWACAANGLPAMSGQWRRALAVLSDLGHVECDRSRQRVAVAPGTLLRLPASNGLHVLCGARPAAVLERVDDPDDLDEAVAEAASALVLHRRIPLREGQPAGPTAVLVEWDTACRDAVVSGLRAVGIELGDANPLPLLPTLDEALVMGPRLSAPPSRRVQLRVWPPYSVPRWAERATDESPGLYVYRLRWRNVFAFRSAAGEPIVEVDALLGLWADERARGRDPRMLHQPLTNRLLVDAALPLPSLLARALALRTGLPAWRATAVVTEERRTPTDYLVYDNVNAEAAQQAARVTGQPHVSTTATLEEP